MLKLRSLDSQLKLNILLVLRESTEGYPYQIPGICTGNSSNVNGNQPYKSAESHIANYVLVWNS